MVDPYLLPFEASNAFSLLASHPDWQVTSGAVKPLFITAGEGYYPSV
jgi:hypothetical protein